MNADFQFLAGVALMIFAITAPLAYCTTKGGRLSGINAVMLECTRQKGEWNPGSWTEAAHCTFPKPQSN